MMAQANEQAAGSVDVLMVVDDDVLHRLGSVVRHLCVGMLDEAVRMTVLAWSVRPVPDDAIGPARVVNLSPGRWPWPWGCPDAGQVLQEMGGNRPDVVHCLSADLARWLRRWAAEWNIPLMVHLTDLVDARQFRRLGPGPPTMGVAATGGIARVLQEKWPGIEARLRVVPLGVPAGAEPACLARPERVPAAVVTTPLTRRCGLESVFKALRSVVQGGREVQLFVLASGPAERTLRRRVDQLGLRSYVTFAGRISDWTTLREAMRGADFYILPRPRPRFTISILTAMASGLAVLAPAGAMDGYLIDGMTASLFDPQVPRALTDKWAAMLDDPPLARRLARGALDHIRVHHQASGMVTAVAGLYRELCGRQPAGAAAPSRS